MNEQIFKTLFFSLFLAKLLTKLYLNWRNKKFIIAHRKKVPDAFHDKISLFDHQKAADYSVTKINFSQLNLLISSIVFMIWLPLGGLNFIIEVATQFSPNLIIQTLMLFFIYSFFESLIQIPLSLYSTFVIEEKFGFNKMTLSLFFKDLIKSTLLSIFLMAPLLSLLVYIMTNTTHWWFYSWLVIVSFQFIIMWAYPRFIAPLFNKFSPLNDENLKINIFELLKKTNLQFKDIFVMDASLRSSHGNAYFTGFGKNKRIVFFDTLLKNLNHGEILAILAHELGHFKHKHILKSLIISTLMLLIGLFIVFKLHNLHEFWNGHFVVPGHPGIFLLLFSLIAPLYIFWATPLFSYFSRKNEFEADTFAVMNTKGEDLEKSLIKLYQENASTLTPDPIYSKFYFSHPPALERIEFIRSLNK
jgi:STE24 endopeptidase